MKEVWEQDQEIIFDTLKLECLKDSQVGDGEQKIGYTNLEFYLAEDVNVGVVSRQMAESICLLKLRCVASPEGEKSLVKIFSEEYK